MKDRLPDRAIERAALGIGLTVSCSRRRTPARARSRDNRATFFTGVEERVLLGVHLEESGEPLLRTTLEATNQPPIDVALLAQPGQRDHVPSVDPDDDELWLARAQFRVAATPTPGDLPFAHAVTGSGIGGDLDLSSCAIGATSTVPTGYVEVPAGPAGNADRLAQSRHERDRPAGARRRGVGAGIAEHPGGSDGVRRRRTCRTPALRITPTTPTFGVCDHD